MVNVSVMKKGLSLVVDYRWPLPETIHTDPDPPPPDPRESGEQCGQVHRARRRSASPSAASASDDGSARMQFAVSDTGIGIPTEKIDELFQPFMQVDGSASRRYGGTGLGLAISKRLAAALGGDIGVVSELGKGSTFTLTIDAGPLRGVRMLQSPELAVAAEEGTVLPKNRQPALQGRVLLAEDVPDVQFVLASGPSPAQPAGGNRRRRPCGVQHGREVEGRGKPLRPDLDGHPDAENERLRGHALAPPPWLARPNRGPHRACHGRRPRKVPGSGLRRLPVQTGECGGAGGCSGAALGRNGPSKLWCGRLARPGRRAGWPIGRRPAGRGDRRPACRGLCPGTPGAGGGHPERPAIAAISVLLKELAHQLKGSAALYGFTQIADAAHVIHRRVTEEADLERIEAAVGELVKLCCTSNRNLI